MALNFAGKKKLKKELEKRDFDTVTEMESITIEDRCKSKNLIRLLQEHRNDQNRAEREQNAKEQEAYRERRMEQEETLARELEQRRRKEICDVRERQNLRESSHELKELETKLRAAYVTRELRAQMAEQEEKKRLEKIRILETNKILEEARMNEIELDRYLKQQEIIKKHQYMKELQDQMIYKEKMKRCSYEDFLREKKLIDQIVERIHLEDERALQEKWLKMQRTKEEMLAFKEAQELWKQKQRQQIEEENRKIQEYMFTKQSDVQAKAIEKQKKEQAREEIADRMAKQMYEERTKQKERDDILQELLEQERIESEELREQKEVEKRFRQRIDMIRGLDSQVKEQEEMKRQMAEEETYYKNMMEKNAEEDKKLEMMSAEKRRIRKMQLRKDLQDLMDERRRKHAENMQIMLKLHEQEMAELAERKRKIEEERIRMLKEHAEHLIGYIPRGILREEDLPLLGEAVYQRYKPKVKNMD